jgi:hypothetical protein
MSSIRHYHCFICNMGGGFAVNGTHAALYEFTRKEA